MKGTTALTGILCLCVISTAFIQDNRSEREKIDVSGFALHTVRADGLCLYVRVAKDGSYERIADKTRVWTPKVNDRSVIPMSGGVPAIFYEED
jgi:hypothetical protein